MTMNRSPPITAKNGFAMSVEDLCFVRDYFKKGEGATPPRRRSRSSTPIRRIHCRHTTFATEIKDVHIHSDNPHVAKAYGLYQELFDEFNAGARINIPA